MIIKIFYLYLCSDEKILKKKYANVASWLLGNNNIAECKSVVLCVHHNRLQFVDMWHFFQPPLKTSEKTAASLLSSKFTHYTFKTVLYKSWHLIAKRFYVVIFW